MESEYTQTKTCSLSLRVFAVSTFLWLFLVSTYDYTCMSRYNRELSARWSFGALYSRGCYFQEGIIIQASTVVR